MSRDGGGPVVGIDLGTTNCCVALFEDGAPRVIPGFDGEPTIPSVLAFTEDGRQLVGGPALRQAVTNPRQTVTNVKRLMGRKHASAEVAELVRSCPFAIVAADNGDAWVEVGGRARSPQELSSMLLAAIKAAAERHLRCPVERAVITVPAHFDDNQRQATRDAGELAGLRVERMVNEPTAAALAFGCTGGHGRRLAVFDLGGGTFDVSVLELADGVVEVLATDGDPFLGGDDVDRRLVEHVADGFRAATGMDLRRDRGALQRLRQAATHAKHELSEQDPAEINLPFVTGRDGEPLHLRSGAITRELLESLIGPELTRLERPCLRALEAAGLRPDQLDGVLLAGGATRIPAVRRVVRHIFGARKVLGREDPDRVVALGAAVQGAILGGQLDDALLVDVLSHSVGIRVRGGRFSPVVPRNSRVPCRRKKVFTPAEQGQNFVDLEVYQGEAEAVEHNAYLGRFTLHDLPLVGQDKPCVEVSFTVDASGMLEVTAREMQSGKQSGVRIQPAGGLTRTEIDLLRG